MITPKNSAKWLIIPLFVLGFTFLSKPADALAWFGHKRSGRSPNHYHSGYPFGRIEIGLPKGFISLSIRGGRYYYHGGIFYRREPRGYAVVPAPVGAVVYAIPGGCHRVIIDGRTYYAYDGIYYEQVAAGYQVVQPPETVVVEPATVTVGEPAGKAPETFTVNLPNSNGGYTSVVLTSSGDGFIGPQGEFYKKFPKIEQLRLMYAR